MRKAAVYLLSFALAGCASNPVDHVVKIHTNAPPGKVKVREGQCAYFVSGAGEVRLNPTRDHALTVEAEGYKPAEVAISSHFSPAAFFGTLCAMIPIAPLGIPLMFVFGSQGVFDALTPGDSWVSLVPEDTTEAAR
jgi:hypothetical protein